MLFTVLHAPRQVFRLSGSEPFRAIWAVPQSRGGGIRTHGPSLPKRVRYQAAPHPGRNGTQVYGYRSSSADRYAASCARKCLVRDGGRSSMVEFQSSKLTTRVRFPSPAPRGLEALDRPLQSLPSRSFARPTQRRAPWLPFGADHDARSRCAEATRSTFTSPSRLGGRPGLRFAPTARSGWPAGGATWLGTSSAGVG